MDSWTNEFCIMPDNPPYWRNFRFAGSERHECFEGRTGNRKKSIEDGLVIFLTPGQHRIDKYSVHKNKEYSTMVKKSAQEVWCRYYDKTKDDFLKKYGRNYL